MSQNSSSDTAWPASLALRIEAACAAFESEWRTGRDPLLESFLGDAAEPERQTLLRELLAVELQYRVGAVSLDLYVRRFPEYAPAILKVFQQIALANRDAVSTLADSTCSDSIGSIGQGTLPWVATRPDEEDQVGTEFDWQAEVRGLCQRLPGLSPPLTSKFEFRAFRIGIMSAGCWFWKQLFADGGW